MTIHRYNLEKPKKATVFYIQSHGLHAGRPLKEPIPNSWEMDTETKNAFEICFMVYNSKFLKNYLRGSVIPFLSLHEYKKIIQPLFTNPIQHEEATLKNPRIHSAILTMSIHLVHKSPTINQILKSIREVCRKHRP